MFYSLISTAEYMNDIPSEFCDPAYYQCSRAQQAILQKYNAGQTPALAQAEGLYVGSCFMLGESYDSDHEHYGYIFLRKNNSVFDFYGQFAFFYTENPYEILTVKKASELNAKTAKDTIFSQQGHWQSNISEDPPWQYFIKQSPDMTLSLIGIWGRSDAVLCQLHTKQ